MFSKQEHLNLNVFNTITRTNESKILTKHVSCKFECKFDHRKCKWNYKWNNNKCQLECRNPKEHTACEKGYIWNPSMLNI